VCNFACGAETVEHAAALRREIGQLVKGTGWNVDGLAGGDDFALVTDADLRASVEYQVDLFLFVIVPGDLTSIRVEADHAHAEVGGLDRAGTANNVSGSPASWETTAFNFRKIRDIHASSPFEMAGCRRTISKFDPS
jgi:hypothetical protein